MFVHSSEFYMFCSLATKHNAHTVSVHFGLSICQKVTTCRPSGIGIFRKSTFSGQINSSGDGGETRLQQISLHARPFIQDLAKPDVDWCSGHSSCRCIAHCGMLISPLRLGPMDFHPRGVVGGLTEGREVVRFCLFLCVCIPVSVCVCCCGLRIARSASALRIKSPVNVHLKTVLAHNINGVVSQTSHMSQPSFTVQRH